MSQYSVPFAKQELLHHILQVGGSATCPLYRPETSINADIDVELCDESTHIKIALGDVTGSLTLKRRDRANHLHLRDFIQDVANGRIESARPTDQAIALMEAFDSVAQVIHEGQVAYVTPTTSTERPLGAVVTDAEGQICAAVQGKTKESLAELVRLKLRPHPEGHGEHL